MRLYFLGFSVNVTRKGLQIVSVYKEKIIVRRNDILAVQPRDKIRRLDNPNTNKNVFVNRTPVSIGDIIMESMGQQVRAVPAISVVSTKPFNIELPGIIPTENGILNVKATLEDQAQNIKFISKSFEIQVFFIDSHILFQNIQPKKICIVTQNKLINHNLGKT